MINSWKYQQIKYFVTVENVFVNFREYLPYFLMITVFRI